MSELVIKILALVRPFDPFHFAAACACKGSESYVSGGGGDANRFHSYPLRRFAKGSPLGRRNGCERIGLAAVATRTRLGRRRRSHR